MMSMDETGAGVFPTVRLKYRPASNASSLIPSDRICISQCNRMTGNLEETTLSSFVEQTNNAIDNITIRMNGINPANTYMLNSWSDFQKLVQAGEATSLFKLGDMLICNHVVFGCIIFEIIGFNAETAANGNSRNSVTLMMNKTLNVRSWLKYSIDGTARWSTSDIRKWANSDADNGEWYLDTEHTDIPEAYALHDGFLKGLDPEMRDVLVPVKKSTAIHLHSLDSDFDNDVFISNVEETEDLFFIPSLTEVNGGDNNGQWENDTYPYFYDDTVEGNGYGTGGNFTRGGYGNFWLRSAAPSAHNNLAFYVRKMNGNIVTGIVNGSGMLLRNVEFALACVVM